MNNPHLEKYLKDLFKTNTKREKEIFDDAPQEVQVKPGVYYNIGASGKVYAIYGEEFRKAIAKNFK